MSAIKPYISSNLKALVATSSPEWREQQLAWNKTTTEKYMFIAKIRDGGNPFKNILRSSPCVPEYIFECSAVSKIKHLSRLENRELSPAEKQFHRTEAKLSAVAMGATTLMALTPMPIVSGITIASTFPFSYLAGLIGSGPLYLVRLGVDYHLYRQGRDQQRPLLVDG